MVWSGIWPLTHSLTYLESIKVSIWNESNRQVNESLKWNQIVWMWVNAIQKRKKKIWPIVVNLFFSYLVIFQLILPLVYVAFNVTSLWEIERERTKWWIYSVWCNQVMFLHTYSTQTLFTADYTHPLCCYLLETCDPKFS